MNHTTLAALTSAAVSLSYWLFFRRRQVPGPASPLPLPPGPSPLPFLGNVLDMPRKREWETFSRWHKAYGDIVFVSLVGRPMIILNSFEATTELLDDRSTTYSDRPRFPLIDLIDHEFNFGFMAFGQQWKTNRRLFSNQYNKNTVHTFEHAFRASVSTLLRNLLRDPESFADHLRLHAGQVILDVTYGVTVTSREDPLIRIAEAVMDATSVAISPAMWVLNPIPILQSLPTWLGGENLSRRLRQWQKDIRDLQDVPFERVKASLVTRDVRPSFTSILLQEDDSAEQENMIRQCAAVAYGAASDTTVAAAVVFFLTMALYPDVQKKAQAEIDRVVGSDRLPNYTDQGELPYVTAVLKEVQEIFNFLPGLPHMTTKDDEYIGYRIPAGSIVVGNIWGMLHDPRMYPDPSVFDPERYLHAGRLDCSTNDPSRIAFGFGRRSCPGKNFAETSLWLLVAQCLAVYSISPADEKAAHNLDFTSGAISHPIPFPCIIRPRSESARMLLENISADL
ncbi:cytochrome P450 monooxygenase 6 [Heterobasidion irregulare TC 32-1]|uniref:Cytochrome P450 monooxygenase 6 n=1 Tax=Heterobasidion irregulare (strain TC 32-1) TaxID=747525 RepID=W4K5W9_HETIT|nr:cytochrome P450 monooxygenase 6 [Heterobasidion irregulare TC 32-1]ETW81164.1 cytochrome P450 monooxygenase 6 [Heterobasidion irregulare TC 32-1]